MIDVTLAVTMSDAADGFLAFRFSPIAEVSAAPLHAAGVSRHAEGYFGRLARYAARYRCMLRDADARVTPARCRCRLHAADIAMLRHEVLMMPSIFARLRLMVAAEVTF